MSRKTVTAYTNRLNSQALDLEELQHLTNAELAAIVYAPVKVPVEDSRRCIFTQQVSYFLNELKNVQASHASCYGRSTAGSILTDMAIRSFAYY